MHPSPYATTHITQQGRSNSNQALCAAHARAYRTHDAHNPVWHSTFLTVVVYCRWFHVASFLLVLFDLCHLLIVVHTLVWFRVGSSARAQKAPPEPKTFTKYGPNHFLTDSAPRLCRIGIIVVTLHVVYISYAVCSIDVIIIVLVCILLS